MSLDIRHFDGTIQLDLKTAWPSFRQLGCIFRRTYETLWIYTICWNYNSIPYVYNHDLCSEIRTVLSLCPWVISSLAHWCNLNFWPWLHDFFHLWLSTCWIIRTWSSLGHQIVRAYHLLLRIDSTMCFVFGIHVYFKLFLHVFHAYQYVSGRSVLLLNKIDWFYARTVRLDLWPSGFVNVTR